MFDNINWALLRQQKEDREPTEETCKNCANIYYEGSVNTGPHNLCEGRNCQDMKEKWKPEVGDLIMFKPSMNYGEEVRFPTVGPYKVDKILGYCIGRLSGQICYLAFERFQPLILDKTKKYKITREQFEWH